MHTLFGTKRHDNVRKLVVRYVFGNAVDHACIRGRSASRSGSLARDLHLYIKDLRALFRGEHTRLRAL